MDCSLSSKCLRQYPERFHLASGSSHSLQRRGPPALALGPAGGSFLVHLHSAYAFWGIFSRSAVSASQSPRAWAAVRLASSMLDRLRGRFAGSRRRWRQHLIVTTETPHACAARGSSGAEWYAARRLASSSLDNGCPTRRSVKEHSTQSHAEGLIRFPCRRSHTWRFANSVDKMHNAFKGRTTRPRISGSSRV